MPLLQPLLDYSYPNLGLSFLLLLLLLPSIANCAGELLWHQICHIKHIQYPMPSGLCYSG